ncbi:MAG: hypothetical protein U0441_28995 [Polyangiaceae bacterium]
MLANRQLSPSVRRAPLVLSGALLLGLVLGACQDRPICPVEPKLTAYVHEKLTSSSIDKVDVVLAIDNSHSMADKQALLALAVPDLVGGLVNPPCLDETGAPVSPAPKSPLDACPKGSDRPFDPVLDIHIGVVTSSLGGHGSDSCLPKASNPSLDDRGHLVARADAAGAAQAPTYQGLGFLAWDPAQRLTPPGEADLDADSATDPNGEALLPVLAEMISGAGEHGCGFESQLESWYRFLVDPSPYETLSLDTDNRVKLEGVDKVVLDQRKAFLRPDSLLAIVQLSDEDDCSVRDTGQYYLALQGKRADGSPFTLPAPRSECAANPNDQCCFSCGQKGPKDSAGNDLCPPDPACFDDAGNVKQAADMYNLRCWDQKRRFGIDFLQPIERYRQGLTESTITDRNGATVPNPLFVDLDPSDDNHDLRDPTMVILTGIVGVPWQDLARDPTDLSKGFKSAVELVQPDPKSGKTTWDVVLGDADANVAPLDPLMIPSNAPRTGKNPVTGDELVTADKPLQNPINGHEMKPTDQLEYACIFPLPQAIPCDGEHCLDPSDSPVFDPPYDGSATTQKRAGAVPGTRFLRLLKSLGQQGVAASVCPAQTTDPGALDFGYRPAIAAALARLQVGLSKSCLPRKLVASADGQVNTMVIEARRLQGKEICCDPSLARLDVPADKQGILDDVKSDPIVQAAGYDCFCEIPQLTGTAPGEPLWTCQNDASRSPQLADGTPVSGYCYVDQTADPPIGNPALVDSCPDSEKRNIRFVGKGSPNPQATVFITAAVSEDPSDTACDASASN